MIVTEQEAKAKWCPFARVARCNKNGSVNHYQSVCNRFADGQGVSIPDASKCIASICMEWEFIDPEVARQETRKPHHPAEDWNPNKPPDGDGWLLDPTRGQQAAIRYWFRPWPKERRGECGLKTKELYCNAG